MIKQAADLQDVPAGRRPSRTCQKGILPLFLFVSELSTFLLWGHQASKQVISVTSTDCGYELENQAPHHDVPDKPVLHETRDEKDTNKKHIKS